MVLLFKKYSNILFLSFCLFNVIILFTFINNFPFIVNVFNFILKNLKKKPLTFLYR